MGIPCNVKYVETPLVQIFQFLLKGQKEYSYNTLQDNSAFITHTVSFAFSKSLKRCKFNLHYVSARTHRLNKVHEHRVTVKGWCQSTCTRRWHFSVWQGNYLWCVFPGSKKKHPYQGQRPHSQFAGWSTVKTVLIISLLSLRSSFASF